MTLYRRIRFSLTVTDWFVDDDDSVDVIRHHHEYIQLDKLEVFGDRKPAIVGGQPQVCVYQRFFPNLTEGAGTMANAKCDETGGIAAIVPPLLARARNAITAAKSS